MQKKILVVNAPDYTTIELIFHSYNSSAYRVASHLRSKGEDVEVLNLRPETHQYYNKEVSFKNDRFYYGDIEMYHPVNRRPCGNWDSEHLSKAIYRVGLPITELIKKLNNHYDEIMITSMFTYLWEGVAEVIRTCKMFSPKSKIILGGVYPRLCYDHAKQLGADSIITERNLEVDFTPIDLSLWAKTPAAVDVITGLGCYNECGYCAVHFLEGRKHICRPPMEVVDEIERYLKAGVKCIRFLDSNPLWNFEKHFEIIVDELLRRNLKAEYNTYGGMDTSLLSPDKLAKLASLGFEGIEVPLETTSEALAKRWNRTLSAKAWSDRVKAVKSLNIPLRTFVLGGCVGQEIEDIQDALTFAEDNGVDPYLLLFTPIPGTKEWTNCRKEIGNRSLEELNPLLYPMANEKMKAGDLHKLVKKYSGYTLSFLTEHSQNCRVSDLREE